MIIELHIDGELSQSWEIDDIREDYSEEGIKRFNYRKDMIIEKIKEKLSEELQLLPYEFNFVYGSRLNDLVFSERDIELFNKEISEKWIDKIVTKYKKVG